MKAGLLWIVKHHEPMMFEVVVNVTATENHTGKHWHRHNKTKTETTRETDRQTDRQKGQQADTCADGSFYHCKRQSVASNLTSSPPRGQVVCTSVCPCVCVWVCRRLN